MRGTTAYKYSEQAFYVANAGLQKTVMWLNNSYTSHMPSTDYDQTTLPVNYGGNPVLLAGQTGSTSNYPESAVSTNFAAAFGNQTLTGNAANSGVYALNASLRKYMPVMFINTATFITHPGAIENWHFDSRGYWGTVANPTGQAEITATIENSGNAVFDRALWGIVSVSLSGTVLIDSYNPVLGPYGGTNIGNLGSIASNGNIGANGNVSVYGDISCGPAPATCPASVAHSTSISHLPQTRTFPPILPFTIPAGSPSYSWNNGSYMLSPGTYGTISLEAKPVLTLNPGAYYIDTLSMGAQASVVITGPTTIFIKSGTSLEETLEIGVDHLAHQI